MSYQIRGQRAMERMLCEQFGAMDAWDYGYVYSQGLRRGTMGAEDWGATYSESELVGYLDGYRTGLRHTRDRLDRRRKIRMEIESLHQAYGSNEDE